MGSYAINRNTLDNSNYTITYNGDNFTINPLAVTVTADAGQQKTYGDVDPAAYTYTSSPAVGSTLANGDVISFSGILSRVAGESVGSYAINRNTLDNSNYTITYNGDNFTINPKSLAITANDQSKCSGVLFTFNGTEFSSVGLINSDAISSVTLTSDGAPVSGTDAGSPYPIIPGNAVGTGLTNYAITYNNGSFTVVPNSSVTLSSAAGTDAQTVCINFSINDIQYTIGGSATNASITSGSLPDGVTGSFSGGVFTITGTPTVSGSFNYTITATGPCADATISGTIIVNADATISLSSMTGSDGQTICINNAINGISYAIGGGGTGAQVVGLPDGVTGNYNAGVFTISGAPTVSGTFNYTVTTTGPCVTPSLSGTITVNANSTINLSSAPGTDAQTVCINNAINLITYAIDDGSTGGDVTGLPNGVTGSL